MPSRIDKNCIPEKPDLQFESIYWSSHLENIAGLDEAGRGAWAGPVVAAAVILPMEKTIEEQLFGVRDSKQLSPEKRAELVPIIKSLAKAWGIGFSDNLEIDQFGILPATKLAMMRAIRALDLPPDHLLIDALFLPDLSVSQTSLIKGDRRSLSIAAASILAKTARDEFMVELHKEYPVYQFNCHKGYGTKIHQQKLSLYGKCVYHRETYKPIQALDIEKA